MNKLLGSLLGGLMMVGLVAGSAAAGPQLGQQTSKGPAIAARREAASDFTRKNTGGDYYSSGNIVRARDVRTTLVKTSPTGTVKTYRATEKGGGQSQLQKVRKVDGGWKAYKGTPRK